MRNRHPALLGLFALAGCATVQLSPQAQNVAIVDKLPTDAQYEEIGPVEAALGASLATPTENKEALRIALRNRGAQLGADCVVVTESSSGVLSTFSSMKGIAYRKKGRARMASAPQQQKKEAPAAERTPPPPLPVVPAAPEVARIPPGKLAVLDFKSYVRDLQPEQVRYFADVVRSAAVRVGPQLEVMTRENLVVLLQASGRDLAKCEGECEVETGRLIGADVIVSGDLQRIGRKLKLSLRLHETRGGRLLAAEVSSGKDVDELDQSLQDTAARLLTGAR